MKMIQNIFLIILGIIISLALIEVLLSIFPQLLPHDVLVYKQYIIRDSELMSKMKPNVNLTLLNGENQTYTFNTISLGFDGIGFRDDGINAGKTLSIVLGDSFAWGSGVNSSDNWVEILESTSELDVVNMGMFGYTTYNELKLFNKYGLKLKPKIVFLAFYSNDVIDNYQVQRIFDLGPLYHLHSFAFEYSNIYKWFSIKKGIRGIIATHKNNTFCFGNYCDEYQFPIIERYSKENQVGMLLTKKYLGEMADITKENNITLVIILIPSKELIFYDKLGLDDKIYKKNYPISDLMQFCIMNNLKCIDLTKLLAEEFEKGNKIFISKDGHFTAYVNQIVAKEVKRYLIENRLI